MAKNEKVAIGIDMGSSSCTVGVYQNGQVEIILNEGGNCLKSDCGAITDKENKPGGELVKAQDPNCPQTSTICDLMKLTGKTYYEEHFEQGMKMLPFKMVKVNGEQALEVTCVRTTERKVTPVDVSTMILAKVKEIAECFLGKPVDCAVITVPVYFNEFERKATKEAAHNAGFNVVQIMNEPIAAALAYGFLQKEGKKYALVFDLGGGTLDVSVFEISDGVFHLKATCGNTHLGGKDFDAVMVSHFAKEIMSKHGIDVMRNPQALEKLKAVCEQAKRCLSTYDNVIVKIEDLTEGRSFKSSMSRTKFEELNAELFNRTLSSVDDALNDANIFKQNVSEIVLVGGSTKIPKIQSLLKEFFCGKELTQTAKPEEAIAYGAAIQAAVVAKEETEKSKDILCNVAPLSLGIKSAGGVMCVFVPRNTLLPCSFTQEFSTYTENQPSVLIQVYEGEETLAKDNTHLGDLELSGLPPAPAGALKIEVTFCVDKSGIIIVTAREKMCGIQNAIIITKNYGRLSTGATDKMLKGSEKNKEKEKERLSAAVARSGLESFCLNILDCKHRLRENDYKVVTAKAADVLKWLERHPRATKEDIQGRQEDVQKTYQGALTIMFHECSAAKSAAAEDDECTSEESSSDSKDCKNELPSPSTPRPSTPSPSTPRPSTPSPSTPRPSTPSPSTPSRSTPSRSTRPPSTPSPSTPSPSTPSRSTRSPTTPSPSIPSPPKKK